MRIEIVDVGLCDGLQSEDKALSPEVRADLCDRLAAAGVPRVEAASFVNSKLVPQMAGAEEVMAGIERRQARHELRGARTQREGLRAGDTGRGGRGTLRFPGNGDVAERNQNTTVADATALAGRLVERARLDGVCVSITLSAAFGCPFEGRVEPEVVLDLAERVG